MQVAARILITMSVLENRKHVCTLNTHFNMQPEELSQMSFVNIIREQVQENAIRSKKWQKQELDERHEKL